MTMANGVPAQFPSVAPTFVAFIDAYGEQAMEIYGPCRPQPSVSPQRHTIRRENGTDMCAAVTSVRVCLRIHLE